MTAINDANSMLNAIESGDLVSAQNYFKKSLQNDSDELIYNLAEELYGMGFTHYAKEAYELLLTRYPQEDSIRTALADIAIDDGEIDHALELLSQVNPESDAYVSSLLVKADLYQSEGLNEAAESSLRQAQQLMPDHDIIQLALAEFYFDIQSYHQAIPIYRRLIMQGTLEVSKIDIVARLGVAYAQIGNYDNAIGYLEQIKPENITLTTQFQLAVVYYQNTQWQDAIDLFNDIIDVDPKYTSVYPLLGKAYEKLNKIDEAYRIYQEGLSQDETNSQLYRLAGITAQKLNELESAETYLVKAIALDEADTMAITSLAQVLLLQDRAAEVIALILNQQENDVIDNSFYWVLAKAYEMTDEYEKASENYDLAWPLLQNNTDFLLDAMAWYRENGQRDIEIQALQQYLKLVPDDIEMQLRLADYENDSM